MVYIVVDKKADNVYLAKPGVTRHLGERKSGYHTHNPLAKMVCACAGTESAEKYCFSYLQNLGARRITGTEWFYITEEMYNAILQLGMEFFPKFRGQRMTWNP